MASHHNKALYSFKDPRKKDSDKRLMPSGYSLGWVAPFSETNRANGSSSGSIVLAKSAVQNEMRMGSIEAERKIKGCCGGDETVNTPKTPWLG